MDNSIQKIEYQSSIKNKNIYMVLILGAAYFFTHFHRLGLSVISPFLVEDLEISTAQLSSLGSAFFYSYASMQIPSGYLIDKYGARIIVSLSLIITAAGSILFGMATSFAAALLSRILLGIGVSCVYIAAIKSLRDWFDESSYGFMIGLLFSLGNLGALAASRPMYIISSKIGWRLSFIIIGIISGLLIVLSKYFIMEKEKKNDKNKDAILRKLEVNKVRKTLPFLSLNLWFIIFMGSKLSFQSLWASQFFEEVLSFNNLQISNVLMMFIIGNIIGAPIIGIFSDKFGRRFTFNIISILFGVCWLIISLSMNMNYFTALIFYLIMGALGAGALAIGFTRVNDIASNKISATIVGYVNCAAYLGTGLITQLTGNIIGKLNINFTIYTSYQILFLLFFILSIILSIFVMYSMKKASITENVIG